MRRGAPLLDGRLLTFLAFSFTLAASGQEGLSTIAQTAPALSDAFPLVKQGAIVTVKFPVLINSTTELLPGVVLRCLYVPLIPSDAPNDLVLAHAGTLEQSFSREPSATDPRPKMPAAMAKDLEQKRRTVWPDPAYFEVAFSELPTDTLHVIFSRTGKERDLTDEPFLLYDGMLNGLPAGHLTVLAIEKESRAAQAGLRAGDEIVAVGNRTVPSNLLTFSTIYAAAKADAKEMNGASFTMQVRRPTVGPLVTLTFSAPLTIKSSLMSGFH